MKARIHPDTAYGMTAGTPRARTPVEQITFRATPVVYDPAVEENVVVLVSSVDDSELGRLPVRFIEPFVWDGLPYSEEGWAPIIRSAELLEHEKMWGPRVVSAPPEMHTFPPEFFP